jgi:hypothetical protein
VSEIWNVNEKLLKIVGDHSEEMIDNDVMTSNECCCVQINKIKNKGMFIKMFMEI